MPEAANSNSTAVSKIHPANLMNNLHQLSQGLKACRLVLASLTDANCDLKTASAAVIIVLDCLIRELRKQADDMAQFLQQCPGSIRMLRDEFIVEKQHQGFSAKEIAQVLNMPIKAVERVIAKRMACTAG